MNFEEVQAAAFGSINRILETEIRIDRVINRIVVEPESTVDRAVILSD